MTNGYAMRGPIKGVHSVKVRLKTGTVTYHYHRASKARLTGEFGSPEFIASLAAAERDWKANLGGKGAAGTVQAMIGKYKGSQIFAQLSPRTRHDYQRMFALILPRFGRAPIGVFSDPRVRGDVLDWRDKIGATSPKTSDMALTVLGIVIRHAIERKELLHDHLAGIERLYKPDRSERIWTPGDVDRFMDGARPELRLAMLLALNTGQRQGDLLRLAWGAYDGTRLTLRQSKTGARVTIPCTLELKAALDEAKAGKKRVTILADSRDQPWKGNGFRLAWRRRMAAAGLGKSGLTFHDLRGTAVTALADAGCTEAEIASITGHSLKHASAILAAYLSRTGKQADGAIAKLEEARARTKAAKNE